MPQPLWLSTPVASSAGLVPVARAAVASGAGVGAAAALAGNGARGGS